MKKMDYLELAAKGCIILGGGMLIGVALYMARAWWLEREKRRSQEAIEQREDEDSGDQQQVLPQHMDEYDGLHAALLRHVNEMIRKVDRQ
jgi:glutamate/tyrosine decarboxylase-like PLP-dependent enzyme